MCSFVVLFVGFSYFGKCNTYFNAEVQPREDGEEEELTECLDKKNIVSKTGIFLIA